MIVGITGGIGSGKTFVCNLFADKGIPVYNTDTEAKKLMNFSTSVKKAIIDLFGDKAYNSEGLNRAFIANQVFSDKELLEQLNNIVHPAVGLDFEHWYKNQQSKFVLKESAILFETGGHKKCDVTILITAPKEIRIKRVITRDKTTREQVISRMKNQWTDEKKMEMATYRLENTVKQNTIEQVEVIFKKLLEKF